MLQYSSYLFSLVWSISLIVTGISPVSWNAPWTLLWPSLLLVFGGLILLLNHRSLLALRFASALCVIGWLEEMPVVPNHRWIHLSVALTVLIGGRAAKSLPEFFWSAIGTLRWLMIVVYFFAALAKMNFAYFEPAISCSGLFGQQTLSLYGIRATIPGEVSQLISLWSLVMEILLPILLLWPRSRTAGVWLGIIFHTSLSLHYVKYFGNFSSVMFVLLISWLPESRAEGIYRDLTTRFLSASQVAIFAACALVALSLLNVIGPVEYAMTRHVLFIFYALRLSYLTFRFSDQSTTKSRVGAPIVFVLLLELINGFSPYLGLKTRSALTMYSNLRIEPEYSNHFFMPPAFDPFGYFGDSVEVLETADAGLRRRIETESPRLSYITLCAYLSCQDDLCSESAQGTKLVFRRGEETVTQTIGVDLPSDCPSWLSRKMVFLGPLGTGSERGCNW